MIGTPRPIGTTKYAVSFPADDIALIYQSGYDWLDDGRFSCFPIDAQIYDVWADSLESVEFHLNSDEEQLYWGVMLDELTIIYGASSEKQTLLDFGFSEVPDDWCGYLFHEGDRLRRKEMERLGIEFSEDRS